MQNAYMENALQHCCRVTLKYETLTSQVNDRLIYTEEGGVVKAYNILSDIGGAFLCVEQELTKYEYRCPEGTCYLDMGLVGCYMAGRLNEETVAVGGELVRGKYIEVEDKIITVPDELLQETQ